MTDALDRLLMSGAITQKKYDLEMRDLARWADGKMATREVVAR